MADIQWPNEHEDLSALKRYAFSKNTDIFSCSTCSTKMFCKAQHIGPAPGVFTGALENVPGLVRYDNHIFVGDTKDGGASTWLLFGPDEKPRTRWRERIGAGDELDASWPGDSDRGKSNTGDNIPSPNYTPLWCHCKGVKLFLKSGRDLSSGTNDRLFKQPELGTGRYTTHTDACDSCRLAMGSDFIHWAFVPIDHLYYSVEEAREGAAPPFENIQHLRDAVDRKDARIGTLTMYRSSERAERYHCSNCSATVFYTEHGLPHQVDVAIGLMDHPDGARAEGLLAWDRGHIDNIEDIRGGWREGLADRYLKEASTWSSA